MARADLARKLVDISAQNINNSGLIQGDAALLSAREDINILAYTHDFYQSDMRDDHHGIKTRYEKMFSDKGEKIKYLKFRFK